MSKYEAGFLGAGNMGGALAAAAARQVTGECQISENEYVFRHKL